MRQERAARLAAAERRDEDRFNTIRREIRRGKRDIDGKPLTDAMRRADVRRGR